MNANKSINVQCDKNTVSNIKMFCKKNIIILANAKRLKYNFKELKVKNVTQASRLKMFNKLKSLLVNTYMCTVAFCKIKPVCLSFKL